MNRKQADIILFEILGTGMSVNIATQEGDQGCYYYRVIHLKCPTPQNLTNKNT